MRVVVVSPVLPLPFGGTDARWLHVVVTELSRRGMEVTCLSSTEESAEARARAANDAADQGFELVALPFSTGEGVVRRRLANLRRPFSERNRSPALRAALEREAQRGYDIIHVEHLLNGWLAQQRPRSVVYAHHLETVDWSTRKDLTFRERQILFQMRRATRHLGRRLPRVIAATHRIAGELRAYGGPPAPVAPIGIDTGHYRMTNSVTQPVIGLIGSMHWSPSRRAAERLIALWPAIHQQLPSARLIVAGWNSERYLGASFPLPNGTLLGEVADPFDFFSQIGALVYPTPTGTGVKVKVLESFAYGVPVVSNGEGFEGLQIGPDEACLAGTDDEFVTQTVGLITDDARRERLRQAARRFVEAQHSSGPAVDRLLDAYEQLGLLARRRHHVTGMGSPIRQQVS